MENRKFKPIIITTGLLAGIGLSTLTGSLVAMNQNKKDKEENKNTEVTSIEATTEESSNILTINGMSAKEVATSSYNNYSNFYDSITSSENVVEEIETMINVINGNVEGLTTDQIDRSFDLAEQIMYSDNLAQAIDNANAKKNEDIPNPTNEVTVLTSPKISDFVNSDTNIISNIQKYEELRDKVSNELLSSETYSDATAEEIRKAVIDMEVAEYNKGNSTMDNEQSNIGLQYANSLANLYLCTLCTKVSPDMNYLNTGIKYSDGSDYIIQISSTPEEQEENLQVNLYAENASDEAKDAYARNMAKLVSTKYLSTKCSLEIQLQEKAGNLISELKTRLNEQKLALLEEKNRRSLENSVTKELSSNEMFKSLSLTF